MAEEKASRYVQITKEQDEPLETIQPGELNQPIEVPQLEVRRCHECGQPLPESYEPPADEPWSTGIFTCADDPDSCWTGLFCPCVLFGRNAEKLDDDDDDGDDNKNRSGRRWRKACICHAIFIEGGIALGAFVTLCHGIDPRTSFLICEGLFFGWWLCGIYTGSHRQSLQRKFHLKDSPCDPCTVHCCMHWCANCQEHRELKGRLLSDNNTSTLMTLVNPPSLQQMDESHTEISSSSEH
ncbi:PLAC8 motif-containing protein [Dioscorea alata]|uniref:PLAC8 motif-containing protein n=1 Tax=Dioscorea alata TaxID=55571 RepID=A0ACB7V524_DIOAL|nr:PLAC8 motif-containing protein [Dioscorea alata]